MDNEPIIEKSIDIPRIGFSFSFRARPSTIKRTAIHLLPWAIYLAMPKGKMAGVALGVARRFSPMVRIR